MNGTTDRQQWTCPECGRGYRLRAGRSVPELCKQCIRRNERAEAKAARNTEDAPTHPKRSSDDDDTETLVDDRRVSRRTGSGGKELPAEVEAYIAEQERRQLLADVANISRSVASLRRLVWSLILMMMLSFVLMGASFAYSLSQLSSVGGLLDGLGQQNAAGQQPQAGPGNHGIPGLDQRIQPIKDYADILNELAKEAR